VNWRVYIIRCSDDSLYTGITTDMERRWRQHAACKGARYSRGHKPLEIVYLESSADRSSASRREAAIKHLPRCDKQALIQSRRNEIGIRKGLYFAGNRVN